MNSNYRDSQRYSEQGIEQDGSLITKNISSFLYFLMYPECNYLSLLSLSLSLYLFLLLSCLLIYLLLSKLANCAHFHGVSKEPAFACRGQLSMFCDCVFYKLLL